MTIRVTSPTGAVVEFPEGTDAGTISRVMLQVPGDASGTAPKEPEKQTPEGTPLNWSDVPGQALSNLPSSAGNLVSAIAHTVMHPIQTAEGIYDVGKGAGFKGRSALGFEQDHKSKRSAKHRSTASLISSKIAMAAWRI